MGFGYPIVFLINKKIKLKYLMPGAGWHQQSLK